jgi:hypothetical protein
MTQNLYEATSFPCKCPDCETMAGFPYRVCTDLKLSEHVRIDLRCRQCKKEWQVLRTVVALPPARCQTTQTARF